ncbi:hypothetical protein RchiOBHm_Chr2g0119611 [Rosa chinensis]|uniref:Uncharacterized protein n=1 Tax=Rosa chinensis TaxID=74649 RepID=A0A2P6RS19_ROSCH|nr:hypothetical protein RchiOBHm_Chr2g0119611 [Rosa chinensis]
MPNQSKDETWRWKHLCLLRDKTSPALKLALGFIASHYEDLE